MFRVARPFRLPRWRLSRAAGPFPVLRLLAVAPLAPALVATFAIGAAAFAQADTLIHIGPFSFPNPFARPAPPSDGTWRSEDRPTRRHSASENGRRRAFADGGPMNVCVRTCDGSFFPLPYSGASGATLGEVCQALCPNAAIALYTMPFGGTIDEAASPTGARYMALSNALKFQQTFDPSCSCRRPDQTWADALASAERRFGHNAHDIIVTVEASARMSRPKPDPDAREPLTNAANPSGAEDTGAPGSIEAGLDVEGVDTKLKAATAAVSREASGIRDDVTDAPVHLGLKAGEVIQERDPHGRTRRVRILAPWF